MSRFEVRKILEFQPKTVQQFGKLDEFSGGCRTSSLNG